MILTHFTWFGVMFKFTIKFHYSYFLKFICFLIQKYEYWNLMVNLNMWFWHISLDLEPCSNLPLNFIISYFLKFIRFLIQKYEYWNMVNFNMAPIHVKCVKITLFILASMGFLRSRWNHQWRACQREHLGISSVIKLYYGHRFIHHGMRNYADMTLMGCTWILNVQNVIPS